MKSPTTPSNFKSFLINSSYEIDPYALNHDSYPCLSTFLAEL